MKAKRLKFSLFSKGKPLLFKKDLPAFIRMRESTTYKGKILVYKNNGIYYGLPVDNTGAYKAFTPIGSI